MTRTKSLSICLVSRGPLKEGTWALSCNLLRSLPLLPNLIFLHIILFRKSSSHFPSLMSKVESLFARTLQEPSLVGDVRLINSLARSYSYHRLFENLTTLRLKLCTEHGTNPNAPNDLPPLLARFFLSVGPTLQLLHISYVSSLGLDLSPVFNDLSQSNSESPLIIPNFKSLSLCLDPATSLRSLQSLRHFLFKYHNILRHLALRLNVGNFDGVGIPRKLPSLFYPVAVGPEMLLSIYFAP